MRHLRDLPDEKIIIASGNEILELVVPSLTQMMRPPLQSPLRHPQKLAHLHLRILLDQFLLEPLGGEQLWNVWMTCYRVGLNLWTCVPGNAPGTKCHTCVFT
ncbi:11 kDa [Simian adenovirus 25]|uniref:11 kDa n=1 Tax=Simian adenovirus 25 TaxID=175567 RepID=Q8UY92_9ADEN|nr:11 kDa [Simian adenovirus 25]